MRRHLAALLFLWLGGCGTGVPYASVKSACGEGLPCGDIYQRDLLSADSTTIDALRDYILSKQLHASHASTSFKRQDDGQGDIDDLMRGLMLVKKLHGINPIFALALSIHESAWGTSPQARGKHNLWGWNAIDGQTHRAATFDSFTHGFNTVFRFIRRSYLSDDGRFFQSCQATQRPSRYTRKGGCTARDCGASLAGMNCMYASDDNWARGIRDHMNDITAYINNHVSPATACAVE